MPTPVHSSKITQSRQEIQSLGQVASLTKNQAREKKSERQVATVCRFLCCSAVIAQIRPFLEAGAFDRP